MISSLDAGEVTDKGYVNQRKVLARRAALVELLYADPPPPGVVTPLGLGAAGASKMRLWLAMSARRG